MTHVVCQSKLRLVVRSSMHLCPGNWVAIGHAVVYFAQAINAFSAGIKCWHCKLFLLGSYNGIIPHDLQVYKKHSMTLYYTTNSIDQLKN